nr:DUF559 domain-containing protein [Yimella sp. cx-51]
MDAGRYRVDFLVDERTVVEFDGAVKYGGANGRQALVSEKEREDALRRAGYAVIRIVWADLHSLPRLRAKLAPLLRKIA